MYAEEEITFTGETDSYTYEGGSGMNITASFCKNCHIRVAARPEVMEGIVAVSIGLFDDSKQFEPKLEIWTSEKLGWLKDSDCVQERVPDSGVSERLMALLESLENR
jgi:hypothetical protein